MACHLESGKGIRELNVPSIAGLPRWYVSAELRKFRGNERGYHPKDPAGKLMQANTLDLDERSVAFLGRFVESLPPVKVRTTAKVSPSHHDAKVYRDRCARCHGKHTEGNRAERGPPLNRQPDWYLEKQMADFRDGKRVHDERIRTPLVTKQEVEM